MLVPMKNKLFALGAVAVLAISLSACADSGKTGDQSGSGTDTTQSETK